ncbi:hypothetical protein [Paenibacillus elgii]|uniref:hypothetical protein n=1 Tax=Paenibacillus elgii TaxID=189691 RepID=UPI00203E4417|nr:hypothetical protein [Paenibacillus elgii]MCM3273596.1 hypothetical protein [Paenibacillus elgii]
MRVVLKQTSVRAYEIVECPEFIKNELFNGVIQLGNPNVEPEFIHPTWLSKITELCEENNVELLFQ